MEAELEKLQTEANQLNKDYLRALAEFDNFRKRKERESTEFREFANEQLLQELIPVLDNFDRAIQAAAGNPGDAGNAYESLAKGVRLIYSQLQEALGRFGLRAYSCIGEAFDPRRCEAVSYLERDDQPEHTVVAESAKGYSYKTKVLRPAMVIVAKKKASSNGPDKENVDNTGEA